MYGQYVVYVERECVCERIAGGEHLDFKKFLAQSGKEGA